MQSLKELTHTIEKGSRNNCYIRKHKGKGLLDETQWTHTTESQAAEVNEFSTTKLAGMPLLSDWQTYFVWASSLLVYHHFFQDLVHLHLHQLGPCCFINKYQFCSFPAW